MPRHQYTIRDVPPSVDRAIRKKAAERRVSLNKILLGALERETGIGAEPRTYDDLDALIGSWVKDAKVDRALTEQRRVDSRDWR